MNALEYIYILVNTRYWAGYYRVLYDEANWRALRSAIVRSEIPPMIRSQLVSDAINLMTSGYLDPQTALEFVGFLSNETDLLVWKSALMAFGRLRDLVMGWNNATFEIEARTIDIALRCYVVCYIQVYNGFSLFT